MKKLFLILFLLFFKPQLSQAAASKDSAKEENTISYYSAIKLLRSSALRENQKLGQVFFGPHQTIWQKIKKDLVDKELRRKAFIKNSELVVAHDLVQQIETKVKAKTKELAEAQGKKQDRMISIGYAESRIRDMLRRAGYHDTEEIQRIMKNVEKSIKQTVKKSKRIALSKLEELTLAAMKQNKESEKHYQTKELSRLGAEVKILTAIKNKKFSMTQEIKATDLMTEALNKQKKRRFSLESVEEIIEKIFKTLGNKQPTEKSKATLKKKASSKKSEQKRGKHYGRGRWGNEKRPAKAIVD